MNVIDPYFSTNLNPNHTFWKVITVPLHIFYTTALCSCKNKNKNTPSVASQWFVPLLLAP